MKGAGKMTRLLALDGIQDPGNLGTLVRTALALGGVGAHSTHAFRFQADTRGLNRVQKKKNSLPLKQPR